MPLPIQRVPRGLGEVLSIFGGQTPRDLADQIQGSIDLLAFYGLSQRTVLELTTAAQAEGAATGPPLPNAWCVLFAASSFILKTATMTALAFSISVRRPQVYVPYAFTQGGPFGATETGGARLCFVPDTPILLPPGSQVVTALDVLGTDATAQVITTVEIGVLG